MSIIIRLQNLPWAANAMDIRQFFTGLQIPEGGVHIVGGELGDAFIAFSTDEDARQAFLRTDGKIKGIQIKLMLSSRTEMQRVIERARNQSMAAFMLPSTPVVQPAPVPAAVPQVIPAAVPEIQKESSKDRDENHSDKRRDRRRSRSKSRDRRDRSRDRRDRRHRDRSRSKSRDRRDRRRGRERSRSRNRSRDRDSRSGRRDKTKTNDKRDDKEVEVQKAVPEIWNNQPQITPPNLNIVPPANFSRDGPGILGPSPWGIESAVKSNLVANMTANLQARGLNGFQPSAPQMTSTGFGLGSPNLGQDRSRESWPSANPSSSIRDTFGRSLDYSAPSLLSNRPLRDGFGGLNMGNFRGNPNDNLRGPMMDLRVESAKNHFGAKEENIDLRMGLNAKKAKQIDTFGRGGKRSRFEDVDPPINACIALEPFYGSYGDLRRFFNGLSINYKGIKIINDEYGHKTGICFVQFRDATNKNAALKMNGRNINNTDIRIKHITDKAFDEAIDRYNPRMDEMNPSEDHLGRTRNTKKFLTNEPEIKDFVCLKIEDLPTFVKEQDILHIFSQHPLISLHLNLKPKGGTVAYVKFGSKEVAKIALNEKSHHIIRGKPITVKPCGIEEFNQVNSQEVAVFDEPKSEETGTDCLSLSKLPAKTTDRDISDFFSDIGVIPTKIHLMTNNEGFNGKAYCEFSSTEAAAKAVSKNNTVLGQNTISVKLIAREEVESILSNIVSTQALVTETTPSIHVQSDASPLKQDEAKSLEETLEKSPNKSEPPKEESSNDSKSVKEQEIISIDEQQSPIHNPVISPLMHDFEDRRFNEYDEEIYDGPQDYDNPHLEYERHRNIFHGGRSNFKNPRGSYRGSRFGSRGASRFNPRRPDSPPVEEDIPGCTVYMDNVPYKAGTNEILDFFEGYNCTNNVSRRYNANNTPSAEAKVTFYNPDDAFRAVRELNGEKIWGRSIFLTQQ